MVTTRKIQLENMWSHFTCKTNFWLAWIFFRRRARFILFQRRVYNNSATPRSNHSQGVAIPGHFTFSPINWGRIGVGGGGHGVTLLWPMKANSGVSPARSRVRAAERALEGYDTQTDTRTHGPSIIWRSTVKGAITSKIKHAIKLKTSPARLAQLLQPSLAFCFSLQPMTAYRPVLDSMPSLAVS